VSDTAQVELESEPSVSPWTADGLLRFDRDGDGALQRAEVAAAKETHELLAGPGRHRPRHVVGTEPLA
jgi:hypothetical protein